MLTWRRTAIFAGGLAVVSLMAGVTFSRCYWGYWFSPPSVGRLVRDLENLHAFVAVKAERPVPNLGWKMAFLQPVDIRYGAGQYRRSPVDAFWYRLHAAVADANLPRARSDLKPELLLGRLEEHVAASALLVDGEPGYPFGKRLNGYAAIGSTRSGDTVVVLALGGSEISNDHYPVFDFEYACAVGGCRLVRQQRYFEDIAGVEGLRWDWLQP